MAVYWPRDLFSSADATLFGGPLSLLQRPDFRVFVVATHASQGGEVSVEAEHLSLVVKDQ